jgi:hypothetical protein
VLDLVRLVELLRVALQGLLVGLLAVLLVVLQVPLLVRLGVLGLALLLALWGLVQQDRRLGLFLLRLLVWPLLLLVL